MQKRGMWCMIRGQLLSKLRCWRRGERSVEDDLIKLTGAVENDYIRDFVRARLLPELQGNLQPTTEEKLASVFLGTATSTLEAICALTTRGFGQDAQVLARTLFERALYLAYIYRAPTPGEVTARAKSFVVKGLTDQKLWRDDVAKLKMQGKCLSLIAELEAAAPSDNEETDTRNVAQLPKIQKMAEALGEPYECDYHFLYRSISKSVHPTAIDLIASETFKGGDQFGELRRGIFAGITYHYFLAELACGAVGQQSGAIKQMLETCVKPLLARMQSL
jgi:predicted small secreted protein